MMGNEQPKQVFDWVPPGKWRHGHPVKSWQQVAEEVGRRQISEGFIFLIMCGWIGFNDDWESRI